MFTLSSSTRVFPSATAGCSRDARVTHKSKPAPMFLARLGVVPFVCFRDNVVLGWFVCTAAVNVAILLQKSTSALAAA